MDLSCIIYSSLNALRCLLQVILQTEDVIRVFEVRLSEEETVPLDLDKVEAYRACLKVRGQNTRTKAKFVAASTDLLSWRKPFQNHRR